MSEQLHAGIAGFDFTPPIHPEYGAWGTTPSMTEVDLPLLGRCLALRQGSGQGQQADQLLLWFALDLSDTLRLALAKGAVDRIVTAGTRLLQRLQDR